MKRCLPAALVFALLAACSTSSQALHVETEPQPSVVHLSEGDRTAIKVDAADLKAAIRTWAPEVRTSSHPLSEARRLWWTPSRSGAYAGVRGRLGLVSVGTEEDVSAVPLSSEPARADVEITRGYCAWCEDNSKPLDCLHLLDGSELLDREGKRALALHFAMTSLWMETANAWSHMVDPLAIQATLVSAMTMYLMLWVMPEPLSKGLAAAMTVALIGYLGFDTVWSIFQGWAHLVEEVDDASSFDQVRASGRRFSKVLGSNAARVFVMLFTAAAGNTAAGFAARLPSLPGAGQASLVAGLQGGAKLSLAAAVETVSVSAQGATLTLAPGALAMATGHESGANTPPRGDTTVYLSRDAQGQVQYVGITNAFARRMAEHLRQSGFRIVQLMKGLSREDARAVEQVLIELYGLQKNSGTLLNRINSIARSNPRYADLLRRGKKLLESIDYQAD